MAGVIVRAGRTTVNSVITNDAGDEMKPEIGDKVPALVKPAPVMILKQAICQSCLVLYTGVAILRYFLSSICSLQADAFHFFSGPVLFDVFRYDDIAVFAPGDGFSD
jgi:hypothetical protein